MSDNSADTPSVDKPLFPLGQVVATVGALMALEAAGEAPHVFLLRHATGDWGDLVEEDRQANARALGEAGNSEERILSAYTLANGTRLWVITEWDRSVTTLLLPTDY